MPARINAVLIAGGRFHDIDFARLELLKLLAEDECVRVRVFEDYGNLAAIKAADILITYTCDVTPGLEAQEALRSWVEAGGRWYALHGTNSILRFLDGGRVDSPDWAPHFMETLGAMFIAHPPIAPYRVEIAEPDHPLVQGIEPFDATDELYLMDIRAELQVLLDTRFAGKAEDGFVRDDWPEARHPVFFIRKIGQGAVLYLTLGHCRGHYDMQPFLDFWPSVDRCAWDKPVFYELLRRGLAWIKAAPAL
jgi:type 1 glutamine amidotransferase